MYEQNATQQTDIQKLHRLFLQYVWRWPFYGSVFFEGELSRTTKIAAQRNVRLRIAVNSEWVTVIFAEQNMLKIWINVEVFPHQVIGSDIIKFEYIGGL